MRNIIILFFLFSTAVFSQSYYPLDKAPAATNDLENPTTPLNLVASNITLHTADLSWTASTDNNAVVGYRIYNNGSFLVSVGNFTNYTISGLTESADYNLTVRALDTSNNESTDSNIESFTTNSSADVIAPTSPINLVASNITVNTADLSWTASTDNIAVAGYRIYSNGSFLVSVGNTTNYTIAGLTESAVYNLTVRALDTSNNESTDSNIESFTTNSSADVIAPTSPINLVASNITENTAVLSWTASTDNVAVASYRIYNNGSFLVSVGNITNYTIAGLTESADYNLTVRALDTSNNLSADSNNQTFTTSASVTLDTIAPTVPTNLIASNIGETTANLSWTTATDNTAVVGYNIYNNISLVYSIGNVTNYSLTGLTENSNYNITVRAFDAAGNESSDSNVESFTTNSSADVIAPTAPLNLVASNIEATNSDLSWTAATDNLAVFGYNIYDNGILLTSVGNITSYTLTGLTGSTNYNITIRAFDAAGNESSDSNIESFTTNPSADTIAPTAPINAVVTNITETTATYTWDSATDNVGVTNYKVFTNAVDSGFLGNATSYEVTGLTPNSNYDFVVKAYDAAGNESQDSNLVSFTTNTSADTTSPTAPLNLVASNITEITVDLTWSPSTDNVALTGYRIYDNNVLLISVGKITTHTLTGLTPDTLYSLTIRAIDAALNESTDSNTETFTTLAPDSEVPSTPLNLVVSNIGNTTVNLNWTASTDNVAVTNYRIYNNGTLLTTIGNVTSYALTGLTASTQYNITVRAVDSENNESVDSNTETFTTSFDCLIVTSQPEVDLYEASYGALSTSARYAHDYLVSFLKCEGIWDSLDDVSTCLNTNYYKLKTSVNKDNIQAGDTGVDLSQYNFNDISLTLDYNDIVNTPNELINGGTSELRLLLNTTQNYKYTAFHCGNENARISHDISLNTKRTFVLTSNTNDIAVATKDGYLIKENNSGNTGSFSPEILSILDVSKLNFFAVGKGLSIDQSKKLATAIKEFNTLMSRTNYNDEVGSYEFIGNSITYGYEPPSNKLNNNYPKLTSYDILGKRDATWNTSNLGVSGIRLDEVLDELQSYDRYGLLTRNPNVDTYTIVSLGTNDFLQGRSATEVKADLDIYTSLLTAAGNKVLVILPHRSTTYTGDNPANYNSQVPTFISLVETDGNYSNGNNAYDTLVFETGNASQDDTNNSTYWYDGLHPRASYFSLMAPIIAPKLEPVVDNTSPSNPINLVASNISQTTAQLNWTASTDNVGVIDYQIYNDGSLMINSTGGSVTNYTLSGLNSSTNYNLTIRARDASNNLSNDSNIESFTTNGIVVGDTYTITQNKTISAGVYDANDNLLKTLISNEPKTAGTYNAPSWDGLSDTGVNVVSEADHIKVIANNIQVTWEGVIGNTSDSFTGATVHRHFLPFHDIMVHNGELFLTKDYTEAWGSVSKASLNSPNSRIDIMPNQKVQQATNRIATDGVRLYMAGVQAFSDEITYLQAARFEDLGNFDDYLPFQGATVSIFASTYKVADIVNDPNESRVSGLAVQTSGNWVVVARQKLNSVHVVHKINGTVDQTLTFNEPKLCFIDSNDDLWMVVNENVVKYSINSSTGLLTPTGFNLTGFQNIQGLTLNNDGSLISIADIDSNGDHKIFEYNTTNGNLVSTLGRSENYSDNPRVHNNKFLFQNKFDPDDTYIGLSYGDDGSIWVSDRGNDRVLKFNASKVYQEQIMFMPAVYRVSVDPNNISRVFAAHREFEVDYNLPLQAGNTNGAWIYKNNWVETLSVYTNGSIKDITTLSNGRTYGLIGVNNNYDIVELDENRGLRRTGIEIPRWSFGSLKPDGTYHRVNGTGLNGTQELIYQTITGFDANNNPIFSDESTWGSYPISGNLRLAGPQGEAGEITSNGVYTVFNSNQQSGFHLGGIKQGDNNLRFRTSPAVVYNQGDPYPPNGEYDNRANVEYGGNNALVIDDYIIWGYNGEFWEGGQTNKYNMYHDSGLFLKQFGETSLNGNLGKAVEGMAGNAFSQKIVKYGNDIYMWHVDESYHAGLHRWKINNLSSVEEFNLNIN